ncbi:MAG: S8 family serine peptidase [Bacillota bacterium]
MRQHFLKKKERKGIFKKSMYLLLIVVLTVSYINPFFGLGENAAATGKNTAEEIIASLSKEQLQALNQLEANENEGLIGFETQELFLGNETTVIVEFQSNPAVMAIISAAMKGEKLTSQKAQDDVLKEQKTFQEYAKKQKVKIKKTYQTTFNGMAITVPANQVESLLELKVIKAVYKSNIFSIEPVTNNLQEDVTSSHRADSIPFLGIDRLHEEGITGKGIKVGVLDTGIDYHHPDLQDVYVDGYDLVDNDDDPMETTYEDWQKSGMPLVNGGSFYYTSHGTHVAGTIAAQPKNTGGVTVKGVAPDVELYGYRVLGPYGTGSTEGIVAGIERAVNDGMDVINLSLGAPINNPFDPTSIAINNAVLSGVVAVVAAGNTGPSSFSLGTPGAASLALTVGASSTSLNREYYTVNVQGDNNPSFSILNFANDFVTDISSFEGQELEIIDLGIGRLPDYNGKDVNGKIVLVNRGVIGTQDKIVYAKNNGAVAIIEYHNDSNVGHLASYVGEHSRFIPAFTMKNGDGLALKALLEAGNVYLAFSDYEVEFTSGDELASFSSRGPSRINMDIKPEVTAPGVSILSTIPAYAVVNASSSDYQYAYRRMSGTSMATPHVAGIAALMLQKNPEYKPEDIKTVLMNTAVPLNGDYSVFDIGAGRVEPYKAIHSKVEWRVIDETPMLVEGELIDIKEVSGGLSFGSFYGDEGNIRSQKQITINNKDKEKKLFDSKVEFTKVSTNPNKNGVKVLINKTISVKGKSSIKTNAFLLVPKIVEAGMYEGYITFTNKVDKMESYRIPFSFRTMDSGFNFMELSSVAISPPYLHVKRLYHTKGSVDLGFRFKSPMERLDLVLSNKATGEDLGYLGMVDLTSAYDGINYNVRNVFNGAYNAFTGDASNPIDSAVTLAQPGLYTIKVMGTSERNIVYTHELDVMVDPQSPILTSSLTNHDSPVFEYSPDQTEYSLSVKVEDYEIEKMMESGMSVDQSLNTINYSLNSNFNPVIPVRNDGTLDLTVPLNPGNPFMSYVIYANDAANNRSDKGIYYFAQEGTTYGYTKSSATVLNMGESFTTLLHLNNVKDMKSASWTIPNFTEYFELVEAKPNNHVLTKADSMVDVELQGKNLIIKLESDKPLNGDLKAVDLQIKVKDAAFHVLGEIKPTAKFLDSNNVEKSIPHAAEEIKIIPTFSEISGRLFSDAIGYEADWTTVGAVVALHDKNGENYASEESINLYREFRVSKLPVTLEPFQLEISLPGHFKIAKTLQIGTMLGEDVLGQLVALPTTMYFTPGDVNQDGVIDILDALLIKEHWNTNNRDADINFDGIVDKIDLNSVVNYYLKKNLDIKDAPVPLTEKDGITLEDILKELGIN